MEMYYLDGQTFASMVKAGAALLHSNEESVNILNVFPVPDGDTGSNMAMTIDSGVCRIEQNETDTALDSVSRAVAKGMLHGARGNSGVILSQLFSGFAKALDGRDNADARTLGMALQNGVRTAYDAVVSPTEGTILTVARESVDYATQRITENSTIVSFFEDLLSEMKKSLERTPELLKILRDGGVVDSGGAGLLYIIEGFNMVLHGQTPENALNYISQEKKEADVDISSFTETSELTYGYCTEFLLRLQTEKKGIENFEISQVSSKLQALGDSVVCFKDDSVLKVHIHTKKPEKVLEFCHNFGEFLTLKIENMSLQHSQTKDRQPKESKQPRQKYATVAVCSGEGIIEVFKDLGVNEIINGGQTNNPSSDDFIQAFDRANSEIIFVLPNNGNIILAARQASAMYKKSQVVVIESKSLGDGYAAMSGLNYDAGDFSDIARSMNEAMQRVETAVITKAIRETTMNNIEVREDDYIGIVDKQIIYADKNPLEVAKEVMKLPSFQDKYAITVFSGKDTTDTESQTMEQFLRKECKDAEIYSVNGGQDIYRFILVAE
ncbi:MAG: DAK2 domain-containing protein [Clostridia bacterium]|nr:DAK2 domain-containing protein [Clostridia bacterium]